MAVAQTPHPFCTANLIASGPKLPLSRRAAKVCFEKSATRFVVQAFFLPTASLIKLWKLALEHSPPI